jgi:pimeloyl-ACP methyl ester carboxylesterase
MTMLGLDKASCCGVLCLFLALAMVFLRAQPKHPATIDEIVSDGGKYVLTTDGRLIEYFTCGKMDDGIPLYFQHGYGNTGKLVFAVPEFCAAAKKLGLKIISPSQPGFGLSSTYPLSKKRTLAEWPADIDLILKQEKVDKFYVSGWSAGCIHALTVANAFSDRTLGIGIGTPTTPLEIEEQENGNMALPTKFVRKTFVIPLYVFVFGTVLCCTCVLQDIFPNLHSLSLSFSPSLLLSFSPSLLLSFSPSLLLSFSPSLLLSFSPLFQCW